MHMIKRNLSVFLIILIILSILLMNGCHANLPGTTGDSTQQNSNLSNNTESIVPDDTHNPDAPTLPDAPEDPSAPVHVHIWLDATCTRPSQCQCGETKD